MTAFAPLRLLRKFTSAVNESNWQNETDSDSIGAGAKLEIFEYTKSAYTHSRTALLAAQLNIKVL